MSSDMLGLIGFIAFFILLGLLGWIAYRRMSAHIRTEQAKQQQSITTVGFTPATDPDFATRLAAHFHSKELDRPYVRSLYKKSGTAGRLWLCHLEWRGDAGWTAGVVLESNRLALPRFLLLPQLPRASDPRALDANRHLHQMWAYDDSSRDFAPIVLKGTRHSLSGPRAGYTESIFAPEFRAWLNQTDGLAISGEGTLLVVWPDFPHPLAWGPRLESDIETNVRRAETCATYLQRRE
jgi:hypothetical protein